jgi:nitrogen regulatory protein P-II 1
MKKVEAYIKPHKLTDVTMALRRIRGLSGGTVFDVRGWGRGKQQDEAEGHEQEVSDFEPHAAVAVFCPDALAPEVVAAIARAARTGLRGDGKIYVLPVEAAVRISTGDRGEAAV